jgi:hypothetical protein
MNCFFKLIIWLIFLHRVSAMKQNIEFPANNFGADTNEQVASPLQEIPENHQGSGYNLKRPKINLFDYYEKDDQDLSGSDTERDERWRISSNTSQSFSFFFFSPKHIMQVLSQILNFYIKRF